MKGLIIKDILMMRSQVKVALLVFVSWFVVAIVSKNDVFITSMTPMYCVILTLSLFNYDEQSNWDTYAVIMPITRTEIVLARYIIMFGSMILVGFTSILLNATIFGNLVESFLTGLASISAGIVLASIFLPLIYKLGVIKARMALNTIFLIFMLGVVTIPNITVILTDMVMNVTLFIICAVIAPLLSVKLSATLYSKKEL